jgi:hypothetical protein
MNKQLQQQLREATAPDGQLDLARLVTSIERI